MKIIAELGICWDGSFKLLIDMIKKSKICGADGIKIQYLKPNRMYKPKTFFELKEGKKDINKYLKDFVLCENELKIIRELTLEFGLIFGATVVDLKSVPVLDKYVDFFKVSSSSFNFVQLHQEINKTKKDSVVSCGGAYSYEIEKIKRYYNNSKLILLYCNYEYPVELENINILRINYLKKINENVGFSNHSLNFDNIGSMCVALGCSYFETHITHRNNRSDIGDHHFSLTFKEFDELCKNIRNAEKILGKESIEISDKKLELRNFCYRKAFIKNDIEKGHRIKIEDIIWLRNGEEKPGGFDPAEEYLIVGKIVNKDLKKYDKIFREDLF